MSGCAEHAAMRSLSGTTLVAGRELSDAVAFRIAFASSILIAGAKLADRFQRGFEVSRIHGVTSFGAWHRQAIMLARFD